MQQALEFQRQGRLAQAEKLYVEVLSLRPDYFEALHMLGLIKLNNGDPAGALQLMLGALKARPKSPEVLLNYSAVLNALGRHAEALASLDLVLSVKRRSVEALNNRGAILEQLGRDEEALQCVDRALAIKSDHTEALYNRGSVLRKLGRHEEALKSFDRVLAIRAGLCPRRTTIAALRWKPWTGATRRWRATIARSRSTPNFVEALNNRANALKEGRTRRPSPATSARWRSIRATPRCSTIAAMRWRNWAGTGKRWAQPWRAIAVKPHYANAQWNAVAAAAAARRFCRRLGAIRVALAARGKAQQGA